MKPSLQHQVRETIRRHRMLRAGDRVAVAVSGGADSVALLLLLRDLQAELGVSLLVVHFNHQLRPEAAEEEKFVGRLAAELGVEFLADRADVAGEARRTRTNLEEAARLARYDFFTNVIRAGRANRVAVGHTADDQAETVLAHILRGTGPMGLGGIYPVAGDVVRPLLEVRREALRDFLRQRGQEWREDATNLDTRRMRARLRGELIPQLEADYQPALVARLTSLSSLARDDEQFWAALVEDRFGALVRPAGRGEFRIRVADLLHPLVIRSANELPATDSTAPLTSRLVRRIVKAVAGHLRGIAAQHVEQVVHLAAELPSGREVQLPGGIRVLREFEELIFRRATQPARAAGSRRPGEETCDYTYAVEIPEQGAATLPVPEIGKRFTLKVVDWSSVGSDTSGAESALDRDRLRAPLVLRNWRPGDAYRPRGRGSERKLKRLFLESRISAGRRAGWPVLTSAGRIAWVGEMPAADEFAARPGTRVGLLIAEETL